MYLRPYCRPLVSGLLLGVLGACAGVEPVEPGDDDGTMEGDDSDPPVRPRPDSGANAGRDASKEPRIDSGAADSGASTGDDGDDDGDEPVPERDAGVRDAARMPPVDGVSGDGGVSEPTAPPAEGRCGASGASAKGKLQLENLCRGVVAMRAGEANFVSWRLLGYEAKEVTFNLYRDGTKVNSAPLSVTNYVDTGAPATAKYTVKAVSDAAEGGTSEVATTWGRNYLDIPLKTASGYRPGDTSVGDLDGDGDYELVVKEEMGGQDPSRDGRTGQPKFSAYQLDGTFMWRVDLGINIREGEHTTPFLVYDLDGDGMAELMVKTGPGTKDGTGKFLSKGPAAADNDMMDYRAASGRILSGPEYVSVFSGKDGAELATAAYEPARGNLRDWGDTSGNRSDRQNATVAFLDGARPSAVFQRGYYARTAFGAYDYRDGELKLRWKFDSMAAGNAAYGGKGVHSVMAADVDGDLKQEILIGGATFTPEGKGKCVIPWYGHGDAIHVGDFVVDRPGLELFQPFEGVGVPAHAMRDAATCEILWRGPNTTEEGPARGAAADISPKTPGAEAWTNEMGLFDQDGKSIGTRPGAANFLLWWDGDESRELLNGNTVSDFDGEGRGFTATGCSSINGSKSVPNLSADLIGDWREEVIFTCDGNLRLYTTDQPTKVRIYTLMHDAQYRMQVTSQNATYNQPPHPSFHIGGGMKEPPTPNIHVR